MMSRWLQTPLLRRILFVLGNLAAGLAIVLACIVPVRDLLAERDRVILQQKTTLARLEAVAARETPRPAEDKETVPGAGEFLTGKTDGIISADLHTRLKSMIEGAGAQQRSVRNLQPRADGEIRYIGSHIELFGPTAAIHRAVYAIESAKPYLFVASATIRLAPSMGKAGTPGEPILEVQLDVLGAMRSEAREP
jgi:general secretion pathway protein M